VRAEQSLERDREWSRRWCHTWSQRSYVVPCLDLVSPSFLSLLTRGMAKPRTLVWGQIRLWQAIGPWGLSCSFLSVLGQSLRFARRMPVILKCRSPFIQDDMSAEYPGGAEADPDCRRTTSPAGAHKAQGLRVTAMTNSNTRRYIRYKKHAYLISTTIRFHTPREISRPVACFLVNESQLRRYHNAVIE